MSGPAGLVVDRGNAYGGTVHHVHDGDTPYCLVHDTLAGFPLLLGCRLRGINAPELTDPGGPEVRDALWALIPPGTAVTVSDVTVGDRAGRIVCRVASVNAPDLSAWLLERGFAVRYSGVGPRPPVPWPPVPPASA